MLEKDHIIKKQKTQKTQKSTTKREEGNTGGLIYYLKTLVKINGRKKKKEWKQGR